MEKDPGDRLAQHHATRVRVPRLRPGGGVVTAEVLVYPVSSRVRGQPFAGVCLYSAGKAEAQRL